MEKEQNYVYGTVYKSNLYTCKKTGQYFTKCEYCQEIQYIGKDSDGYCIGCEKPLGDGDNDLIDSEFVEQMRLQYMKGINDKITTLDDLVLKLLKKEDVNLMNYVKCANHHVGLRHKGFSKDNGFLVDTHIVKESFMAFDEEYESIEWKAGFIVNDEIFEKIKSEEYNGFSIGGKGIQKPINKIIEKSKEGKDE